MYSYNLEVLLSNKVVLGFGSVGEQTYQGVESIEGEGVLVGAKITWPATGIGGR